MVYGYISRATVGLGVAVGAGEGEPVGAALLGASVEAGSVGDAGCAWQAASRSRARKQSDLFTLWNDGMRMTQLKQMSAVTSCEISVRIGSIRNTRVLRLGTRTIIQSLPERNRDIRHL